jgi:hypothetical protein
MPLSLVGEFRPLAVDTPVLARRTGDLAQPRPFRGWTPFLARRADDIRGFSLEAPIGFVAAGDRLRGWPACRWLLGGGGVARGSRSSWRCRVVSACVFLWGGAPGRRRVR